MKTEGCLVKNTKSFRELYLSKARKNADQCHIL